MAISKRTLDFLARIYAPIAFGILAFYCYVTLTGTYLDQQGRPILAIGGGLGLVLLFWMFYVRWFVADSQFSYPTWPPYLATCPDYLTLVSPEATGSKTAVCMDFVGVSLQPLVFRKTDPNNIPQSADADFDSFAFKVDPSAAGDTPEDYNKRVCLQVQAKGLAWAGVCE